MTRIETAVNLAQSLIVNDESFIEVGGWVVDLNRLDEALEHKILPIKITGCDEDGFPFAWFTFNPTGSDVITKREGFWPKQTSLF